VDEVILKLLGLLEQLVEEKGVPKKDAAVAKNIVTSPNSPLENGKKPSGNLNSFEKKRLTESFNLFNKLFFDYKKKVEPDAKEKTKVSQIAKRQVSPPPMPKKDGEKSKFGFGSILGGLLLLVSGLAAFVTGLMTDGPFKGLLKILSRFGIKGAVKLLANAVKPFLAMAKRLLSTPMKFLGKIGKFLGQSFAKLGKFLLGGVSKIGGKVLGKIGGSGLFKMMTKFLKSFAKVFKRIPVIGTILSIAFAYSRFKKGDIVGGTIDVLSGLAGLVDLVLPGLGTAMSIGLDVLNAVLDSKADQGPGKPKRDKLTILKDMASSVGKWIWERRMNIPILSSINRLMMAWDSFKSGDIAGGFGNFGLALSNLVTGVDGQVIMDGVSGFMGLFQSDGGSQSAPKPNKSFISEMSQVVGKKIMELWEWIKQKVKDGIAGLIPGGKAAVEFAKSTAESTKELTNYVADKAKGAYDKTKSVVGNLWDSLTSSAKDTTNSIVNSAKKTLTDYQSTRKDVLTTKVDSFAKTQDVLVKDTNKISQSLYDLNVQANKFLMIIANNTSKMLHKQNVAERVNFNEQKKIVNSPTSQQAPRMDIPNNRGGYVSSPYALG
jgi:hypothetical protein